MPDLIRHPVLCWIPACAGMTILVYLSAGVIVLWFYIRWASWKCGYIKKQYIPKQASDKFQISNSNIQIRNTETSLSK